MKRVLWNSGWRYAQCSYEFLSNPTEPFREVTLPHDALIHERREMDLPGGRNTGGFPYRYYEYKKDFTYQAEWKGRKVQLLFEGVYAATKVYVNSMYAGSCMNGYIPFTVDLDPYLREGTNEIRVLCRNYRDSRWYAGAGIYRNVFLLTSDRTHIVRDQSFVTTESLSADRAVLGSTVALKNEESVTRTLMLTLSFADRRGEEVHRTERRVTLFPGEEKICRQRVVIGNPEPWSPETPVLYTLKASAREAGPSERTSGVREAAPSERADCAGEAVPACCAYSGDEEVLSFGIRTLSLSTEGLFINGRKTLLRGTCIHHDNGILGSCEYRTSAFRRIRKMKEAGINAVRIAHHPASTEILEACDHLGMLVMNEGFDAWSFCKNPYDFGLFFEHEWETVVDRMVERSRQHPSVILYSLGNEIIECGNPRGAQLAFRINERIKSLDPERFTILSSNVLLCLMDEKEDENESKDVNEAMTNEMNDFKSKIVSRRVAEKVEEAMGYADIAGYNYGDTRYLLDEKEYPDRIVCGSETFSEDLASNWALVTSHPQILGDFNWTGWEYLGEAGIGMMDYPGEPKKPGQSARMLAVCGDFDLLGMRRAQSWYREAVWGKAPHPWIAVRSPEHTGQTPERTPWSFFDGIDSWDYPGCEGRDVEIQVYSDADEIELLLNGRSLGRKAAGPAAGFISEFTVPYERGKICAAAWKDGKQVSSWSLSSGEGSCSLLVTVEKSGADEDLLYCLIENRYENGVLNHRAQESVRVCVEGGELLALGSADPEGSGNFDTKEYALYQGRALAVVRGNAEVYAIRTGELP